MKWPFSQEKVKDRPKKKKQRLATIVELDPLEVFETITEEEHDTASE
jgi:hypothetical protein